MSQPEEEQLGAKSQEQFVDRTEGLLEYTSSVMEDATPRMRQLLWGHLTKLMGLTKLDPKPAMAQMYALKADIIFQKFCVTPLELDEPSFTDDLLNAENLVKLLQFQSRYPNPKLIMAFKQYLVREGTSQTIPAPAPQKKGIFGR